MGEPPSWLGALQATVIESAPVVIRVVMVGAAGGCGSWANPLPQVLLGSGLSRCAALSFR